MIKYCIAPSTRIAEFWLKERGINPRTVKIIRGIDDYRCYNLTKENTLVVFGKEFDYPEYTLMGLGKSHQFITLIETYFKQTNYLT